MRKSNTDHETDGSDVRSVNLALAALIGLFAFVVLFIFFSMEIGSRTSLPPTAGLHEQTRPPAPGGAGTN